MGGKVSARIYIYMPSVKISYLSVLVGDIPYSPPITQNTSNTFILSKNQAYSVFLLSFMCSCFFNYIFTLEQALGWGYKLTDETCPCGTQLPKRGELIISSQLAF